MIELEHAFIAYPTMVSSLDLFTVDLAWDDSFLYIKKGRNQQLTSGLNFEHFRHLVEDAGVIFVPFADHLTPLIIILCFPLSLTFRAHKKLFRGASRGGSSTKPGGMVMA
jgi:hypothetical protein